MAEENRRGHTMLEIPELLDYILSYVSASDCARLMATSRAVFNGARPRVWRDVPNVRCLLSLIPGLNISQTTIQLPPFSLADFSRFHIYSPHVEALTIHDPDVYFSISPWRTLLVKARTAPLLPNLVFLHLNHSHQMQDNQILWIHAFVSPSVRIITAYSPNKLPGCDISISALSVLLDHVKQTSPSLETLAIFPGSAGDDGEQDGQHPLVSLLWEAPFHHHLISLSSLRHLITNTSILSPEGISALGALPHLTSLDLSPKHYDPDITTFRSVPLPSGSFPALCHLSLHFLSLFDIQEIWRMDLMINQLSALDIEFTYPTMATPLLNPYSFWETLFPRICACSPGISNLYIDCGGLEQETTVGPLVIGAFTRHSGALPLQQVSIHRCIDFVARESDNFGLGLQLAWAGVRRLTIPYISVDLDGLSHLAALPMLEHLAVCLAVISTDWAFPLPEQVHAGSTVFHTLELNDPYFDPEEPQMIPSEGLEDLAR
ncbi:hypothetical protein FRC08_004913 [Ceratobasidium sp. 394]|nr:hypothetical protein FRC08_004913 [Ceratobasidium sp. 394]